MKSYVIVAVLTAFCFSGCMSFEGTLNVTAPLVIKDKKGKTLEQLDPGSYTASVERVHFGHALKLKFKDQAGKSRSVTLNAGKKFSVSDATLSLKADELKQDWNVDASLTTGETTSQSSTYTQGCTVVVGYHTWCHDVRDNNGTSHRVCESVADTAPGTQEVDETDYYTPHSASATFVDAKTGQTIATFQGDHESVQNDPSYGPCIQN